MHSDFVHKQYGGAKYDICLKLILNSTFRNISFIHIAHSHFTCSIIFRIHDSDTAAL